MFDQNTYGWRALVQPDWPHDGIAVMLARRDQLGMNVVAPMALDLALVEDAVMPVDTGPTLRLPGELGRVLLDALATHYGGASDLRTLRADYLAERARVDRLIERLTK